MAVKTVTTYHCDRCSAQLSNADDGAPIKVGASFLPYRDPHYTMDRSQPKVIAWDMLCPDCKLEISMFFDPLRFQHAKLSDGKAGRAFFQDLLGRTEEEFDQRSSYVNSLMYRAMRLLGRKGPPTEEDPL